MAEVNTHHKPLEDVAREKHNYHAVIPWHKLEKHLRKMEKQVVAKLRRAKDDTDFRFCQGQLDLLDKLMNLPEALTLAEEEDPQQDKPVS